MINENLVINGTKMLKSNKAFIPRVENRTKQDKTKMSTKLPNQ